MSTETLIQNDPEAGAHSDLERDENQFVTFIVADERFAAPMAPVQEIIRVPAVAHAPLSPPSLLGLANLRGRVLPIIDLRFIFQLPAVEATDATRALVIDLGTPLAFVVDRVASVMTIEAHDLEPVAGIQSTVQSKFLIGVVKGKDGSLTMVLDFPALIASEFATIGQAGHNGAQASAAHNLSSDDEDPDADLEQLVSFRVDQQEYAVHIATVQEIVQAPEKAVQVPNAASHVLGLMTLRERLLPLVSLRHILGLPGRVLDDSQRVVVLALEGGQSVGVVADLVDEVLRVPKNVVDPLPALLAKGNGIQEVSSICRLDGGKRLVSVLDTARLFAWPGVQSLINEAKKMEAEISGSDQDDDEIPDDEDQVVVFLLDNEEFGVPITAVQEIVRVPEELTHMPCAPDFVEGIINLRGAVLPVIDQRRRLGLAHVERSDGQRILVYSLPCGRVGFIVDAVSEVLKIPRSAIETAPRLSEDQARVMGRVANLAQDKRMIILIEPNQLLELREMSALKDVV